MKNTTLTLRDSLARLLNPACRLILVFMLLSGCTGAPPKAATPTPAATLTATTRPTPQVSPTSSELAGLIKQAAAPAPVVLPAASADPFNADGTFDVTFDQPMNTETTAAALAVSGPDGAKVDGQVSWPAPNRLRFAPANALLAGSTYQVRLGSAATSAKGAALRDPYRLELATSGPIEVGQVFPARGTGGVATGSAITVLFNRPVVPLVMAGEQAGLPQPLRLDPPTEGKGEWLNTSTYIFHPAKALKGNVDYTVTVPAGLADASGKSTPLQADYTWTFHTLSPTVDKLQIRVNETDYVEFGDNNNTQDVALNPAFSLHFLQAMDPASTAAALRLNLGGQPVHLALTWSDDHQTVSFAPTEQLALGGNYTVALAQQALSVDGSPLDRAYGWDFQTVLPPAVTGTEPSNQTTNADAMFTVKFASPMNLKSIVSRVTFDPPLDDATSWNYDAYGKRLFFYGLKYSTNYTVQIQPGMTDLYGNTIDTSQTIHFRTMAQSPTAWMMVPDRAMFRAGQPEVFYTRMVNVHSVNFALYHISLETLMQYFQRSIAEYDPPDADRVWQRTYQNEGRLDQPQLVDLPLSGPANASLTRGFYLLEMDSAELTKGSGRFTDTRLIYIADANLMLKNDPKEALAWVTDLTSGRPVAGAVVKFYDGFAKMMAQASTNADGLARADLPDRGPDNQYVQAVVDDGSHFAAADSNLGSGVSPYDYGIWDQYYQSSQDQIVYVYTERPIYRPGQPVYFKGIVRRDDDLHYSLPNRGEVQISIRNYKDEEVYGQKLPLSAMGTFNGSFTLDGEAALGTYSLRVNAANSSDNIGYVAFNVAEYRRPEFQVKLNAAVPDILAGQDFNVNLKADYYSGGGLSNANVEWTLRSQPFSFTPPDAFSRYSFSDFNRDSFYDFYRQPPADQNDNLLAQGKAQTDAQGQLTLTLPAKLKTDASQRLVLETNVTDFAGNMVSGRTEVVAHHSAVYPGVRYSGYVGEVGKEQTVELAALDWSGNPAAGQLLDVQIVERRWNSVQEQDPQGNLRWNSTVQEIPVKEFKDIPAGPDGKASVTFVPPNGGIFKAKVTARDKSGSAASASDMIWVAGQDYIPWRQTNDRGFQLVLDRTLYHPGDTAEMMIASPFQGEAYALVTIERGRVRKQEVLKLESNSTVYRLPITADFAPNVYVSVMVVKGVDANNPRPSFKLGMAEIKVATDQQTLNVKVQADKPTAGPGDSVTYTVSTSDLSGQPVQAEVSLGLSDLATLSLVPPNSVSILTGFYDRRGLRVRTGTALVNSIEDYNAEIAKYAKQAAQGRGGGSGGGKGEGDLGVMEIRQNFPDTAYWKADVQTGADGKAQVTVRLPDNLTTWRMDARAVTQDTRVGQTTFDLVSSKPLLLRPQTPRFFIAGDQVVMGAAVHNNTTSALTVAVDLAGQGVDFDGATAQQVQIPANQQAYVSWKVRVREDVEKVDLTFSAKSGAFADASRPTIGTAGIDGLPVYRYEAPETVGTSGQISERGALAESIRLPQGDKINQGELDVSVSPSLSASITGSLDYLEEYPYECTEQTVSRFLPNVMVTKVMKEAGVADAALETNLKVQVNTAVQRLSGWQHEDGGWGWWKEGPSDEQITAYATLGLVEARDAGYDVPVVMLANAVNYLGDHAGALPQSQALDTSAKGNRKALLVYVLARAGRPVNALLGRLYDTRLKLNLDARALLLRAIALSDANDPRIQTLRTDFASTAVLSASGTHWEEATRDIWNWGSDTRTTAIVLGSLVKLDPQNPLLANAVRWLMSHRDSGHWKTTQENAWTLMALADWMRASGELKANYEYAVQLNDTLIAQGQATVQNIRETQSMRVAVTDLIQDAANDLVVARGAGTGSLYYTANLKVYLPVPKIQALDRGLTLTRSYYRLDDPNTPVTSAKQGDLLRGRLTIVVPNALHYLMVDDPLPSGLEALDTSLLTSPQGIPVGETPPDYSWSDWARYGWGYWYFDHVELRDEKVFLSAQYLPAGTYTYTYLVRASLPGIYNVIPPTGQEFYFPEVYGRGDGMSFEIK